MPGMADPVRAETPYRANCGCAYVKVEQLVTVSRNEQIVRMMDLELVTMCETHRAGEAPPPTIFARTDEAAS